MIEKVFYINLDERVDRRMNIENQLNKSNLLKDKLERYAAIDGKKINPKDVDGNILNEIGLQDILSGQISRWGLSLTQGALGLILSYLDIFDRISNSELPSITFEDDVEILENFDDTLIQIYKELPIDFDICYLGHCDTPFERINFSKNLSIPRGQLCCLPGLIISPKGAKKLISLISNIDSQIDTVFYMNFDKLNVFVTNEKILNVKDSSDSDVQGKSNNVKKYKFESQIKNFAFCTITYGEKYIKFGDTLISQLNNLGYHIFVLTDNKSHYTPNSNLTVFEFNKPYFSFHEKRTIVKEVLKFYDTAVFLDADVQLKDIENLNFLSDIDSGLHIFSTFGNIGSTFCSEDISYCDDQLKRNTKYGKKGIEFARKNNLNLRKKYGEFHDDYLEHFLEGKWILKKDEGKEIKFFEIWDGLSKFTENFDIEYKYFKNIGAGEGSVMSIASFNSGILTHVTSPLTSTFNKYFISNYQEKIDGIKPWNIAG